MDRTREEHVGAVDRFAEARVTLARSMASHWCDEERHFGWGRPTRRP